MEKPYIVYVKTDESGFITDVNSSVFIENTTGWIEIDRGIELHFYHAQGNYFPEPIMTESGVWRYKLTNGAVAECTAEEIAEQEKAQIYIPIAERNITAGEYVTVNGTLYKAKSNIPNGGAIITGQNAEETTVEALLYELTKKGAE